MLDAGKLPEKAGKHESVAATFGQAAEYCQAEWIRKHTLMPRSWGALLARREHLDRNRRTRGVAVKKVWRLNGWDQAGTRVRRE
ncbi:hypothetical protein [Desulfovibrio sp. X2]|uniref:hypothetical protein n=1 Tax=Desulfovibrio sp. X2 TaxID=941449 RepID=UPI0005514E7A|nr:hypothetical protein [Desulfovibrio sp. X2]